MPERSVESPDAGASFEVSAAPNAEQPPEPVVSTAVADAPVPVQKDLVLKEVERVFEEGLGDSYHKMNPHLQQKFRKEGERAARTIAEMVRQAKVKAREVLALISKWLKIIPGVNAFFLAQEAKLKTDKIMKIAGKGKLS